MNAVEVRKTSTRSFLAEFKGTLCIKCNSRFVREVTNGDNIYYHCIDCDRVFEFHPIKGMVEVQN